MMDVAATLVAAMAAMEMLAATHADVLRAAAAIADAASATCSAIAAWVSHAH